MNVAVRIYRELAPHIEKRLVRATDKGVDLVLGHLIQKATFMTGSMASRLVRTMKKILISRLALAGLG